MKFKEFLEGKQKTVLGFKVQPVPKQLPPPKEPHPVPKGYKRVKDGSFNKLVKVDDHRYKGVNEATDEEWKAEIKQIEKEAEQKTKEQLNKAARDIMNIVERYGDAAMAAANIEHIEGVKVNLKGLIEKVTRVAKSLES
jgi:hypothetical protein